ncbi:MAG TPA: hypothetical protein VF174_16470 [Micromonosporaceae bacterium]
MLATVLPITGCDLIGPAPEPTPTADPLVPFITGTLALAARYDATVDAFPELAERLEPIARAHRTHAAELNRVTATEPPSPAAPPATGPSGDLDAALDALRAVEKAGLEEAIAACLAAPDDRAALLGSIAAARATHLEMLR